LLKTGNALELAAKLERLLRDPEMRRRIGKGGRDFAQKHLLWSAQTNRLLTLYDEALRYAAVHRDCVGTDTGWQFENGTKRNTEEVMNGVQTSRQSDDTVLHAIVDRYKSFRAPVLGYATVGDYCDSFDHLRPLATRNGDLKDVQRPWMLKAILGSLSTGARLLEIGAGEPVVAHMLVSFGYDVTVVDPYDGSGNGPIEFQSYVSKYPQIKFVRNQFSDLLSDITPASFDCIYSISVLEHVPDVDLDRLFAGIKLFLTPSGVSIHAIDHVLKGEGDGEHHRRLRLMVGLAGIDLTELDRILGRLSEDTDTYFLSAEGHNRWRGATLYDDFPMRRCVSVHLCMPCARCAGHRCGAGAQ
jgi:2-polyprenyl-3-methyl-5-hydroxy-6-metoxy-1,4-benzoquinol methylase